MMRTNNAPDAFRKHLSDNSPEGLKRLAGREKVNKLPSGRLPGLFLRKDHAYIRVQFQDIILLEACKNYTLIYTRHENFLYSKQLSKVAKRLNDDQFMRIHRSYVVNVGAISGFEGNQLLIADRKVPISKQYRELVFELFDVL